MTFQRKYFGCSVEGCDSPHEARGFCRKHYRRATYYDSEARQASQKAYNLAGRYGITLEERAEMLERQGHRCAMCPATEPGGRHKEWHLDHDHSCCPKRGKTCGKCNRGLLCSRCNLALGIVEAIGLDKVTKYLQGNKK